MELLGRLTIPHTPYDFAKLLTIIGRFAYPSRNIIAGDDLWRINRSKDGFALVKHRFIDDGIEVSLAGWVGSVETETILENSRHILGLDLDLTAFYDYAQADEILWKVVKPLQGTPIFRTETVFEALITLIIEQHISWVNALKSQMILMQWNNDRLSHDNVTAYAFPTPQQLANADPDDLKILKITNKRIDFIIRVSQDIVNGDLDLEAIRHLPTEEAYQTLMSIRGVGHWTAANVIGRALGHFPYITQSDVALQAGVNRFFYADEGKKSAERVVETFSLYGDFAGQAADFTLLRWVLDHYPSQY